MEIPGVVRGAAVMRCRQDKALQNSDHPSIPTVPLAIGGDTSLLAGDVTNRSLTVYPTALTRKWDVLYSFWMMLSSARNNTV
jgi:hypothetical protein